MRVVVTGATGNVGTELVQQLLGHSEVESVVGIARRLPQDGDPRVEWHALDVAADDLRPAFDGADAVVHLAWLLQPAHDPREMERVNLGGTQAVLAAAAGVPAFVHASSVGAYSAAPRGELVDESWPTDGIATSTYSRHKAQAERLLDAFEASSSSRVVRLRPGIVLQPAAASALGRYFLGPFVPQRLVRPSLLPVVPAVRGLAIQALHARDMAAAYVAAVTRPVSGAFNVAAGPVLDGASIAAALDARPVPVPTRVAREAVHLLWRVHAVPVDPGWVDLGTQGPLMDTSRARDQLGWTPVVDALTALRETVEAMGRGEGAPTPVLRPRAKGVERLLEPIVSGTG